MPAQARVIQGGASRTTVQEIDDGGQAVAADVSIQREQLLAQIQAVRTNEDNQEKYRAACSRHVEQVGVYVQGAIDRKESDAYIAHVRSLLNESEARLVEAVSKVSEFSRLRELLEVQLNELNAGV